MDDLRNEMVKKFKKIEWAHHPCGRGSVFENTEWTRGLLEQFTEQYDIKTVSDAGAGDLSWVGETKWNVDYTPYDIRKWHKDIIQFDVTNEVLPKTDLIVCRHVLNHLDPKLRAEATKRFTESGSKYIFITFKKIDHFSEMWGDPLENSIERFPGGAVWQYGLWQMNS